MIRFMSGTRQVRDVLYVAVFLFFPFVSVAQVDLYTFSAAGGLADFSVSGTSAVCLWNLGETVTEEFGSKGDFDASKKRLTQGFEQGEGFIADPLDIAESEQDGGEEFEIYPNPSAGFFHVSVLRGKSSVYRVRVGNTAGMSVWARTETDHEFSVDLRQYPDGIYFLQVERLDASVLGKVASRKVFKIIKVS